MNWFRSSLDDNQMQNGTLKMQPKDTAATLYIDKDSWLHRLNPLTKLSYILLTGVAVYAGLHGWKCSGLLLLINFVAAASSGFLKEECQTLTRFLLPLTLFMIPIHAFLYPANKTIWLDAYGMTIYLEGVVFALITVLKLAVVLMASLLFVFSTHPADLITAISVACKSPSLAYLLGSPPLLLASIRERIDTIKSAQRARGLNMEGNVLKRFRSLTPLIIPLVIGAIVEIEQRSIALEVRGFKSSSAKTSLRILADSTGQRLARWLMLTTAGVLIFFRFIR